jgi:cyclopropane fatty-acyl-phospholipid synthase-like methyltransferase
VTGPVFEFSEVFNDDYLYFYGPELEAVSDAQAETIWRLLDLEPGMEVLDLACGHGRIANRLVCVNPSARNVTPYLRLIMS